VDIGATGFGIRVAPPFRLDGANMIYVAMWTGGRGFALLVYAIVWHRHLEQLSL
jgi:hypothetical protein